MRRANHYGLDHFAVEATLFQHFIQGIYDTVLHIRGRQDLGRCNDCLLIEDNGIRMGASYIYTDTHLTTCPVDRRSSLNTDSHSSSLPEIFCNAMYATIEIKRESSAPSDVRERSV